MGYPHRFYGCSEAIEINGEVIPPHCAVEVTFRTFQQTFLLRPDKTTNEILKACFGRVHSRYPQLKILALSFLSNHGSFVVIPDCAASLSNFMREFMSAVGVRINDHRNRKGRFWQRRYRSIPIIDEAMMLDRVAYTLLQGTKENLVMDARQWPGVSSVAAQMGGPPLVGRWRNRTKESALIRQRKRKIERAKKRGVTLRLPAVKPVYEEYVIPFEDLPQWQHLSKGRRRQLIADIVNEDAEKTKLRHKRDGTRPLGRKKILKTDPLSRPDDPKMSPAPRCHTRSPALRRAFYELCSIAAASLSQARERVIADWPRFGVPEGMCLPAMAVATTAGTPPMEGTGPPAAPPS